MKDLPNEILFDCFEHLNAVDIFYAFDQLNSRFNNLIRDISLNFNFQYVRKSIFDKICAKILSNPEIKSQIISLKLSNKDTYGQIEYFLSVFSLDEFPNLKSITLDEVTNNNMEKLQTMLPLISNLYSFHSIDHTYELSSVLLLPKLQTLSMHSLNPLYLDDFHEISSLKKLTISKCTLNELYRLFSCTSMLTYLKVHIIYHQLDSYLVINNKKGSAVNLKKLIINDFQQEFQDFMIFIQQIPKLTSLTISSESATMIDAPNWQNLITTSLPLLNHFQFKFIGLNEDDILNKFRQFQNSFWQDQHHWNTEFVLERDSAYIYTIPYISNTYILTSDTKRYSNSLTNDLLNNVTNLIFYERTIQNVSEFYFPNAESLTLEDELNSSGSPKDWYLTEAHISSLEEFINLNNLKHLNISSQCKVDLLPVLLALLQQSPQLSSLTIVPYVLPMLFTDHEVCIHLNKMIKKLDIYRKHDDMLDKLDVTIKFCEVFSNLEQLKCTIRKSECLLFLLMNLPKISLLNAMVPFTKEDSIYQIEDDVSNLNIKYGIDYAYSDGRVHKAKIYFWMS